MGSHSVKNIPTPIHVFSVSPEGRASLGGASHVAKSATGFSPSTALAGLAVALVSALAVTMLTRKVDAPTPSKTEIAAPATTTTDSPANVAALENPSTDTPAVTTPSTPSSTPPPAASATSEDVTGEERRRPMRWNVCRGDDTPAALQACSELVADTALPREKMAEAQQLLGYAQRKTGDIDTALTSLTASIDSFPTTAAYNDRGTAHLLKGDMASATADYTAAVKLDAKNGEAWNNRAWANYKSGAHSKALDDANIAVGLIADKAYVWDTRGHIHEALGSRKAAEVDFLKALSLDPDLATSKSALKRLTGR